ncbi:MAG: MCE family protein [Alphaproteobacteria bacterium]|nr:MCE family protein [Alphaproteobacteria bacterium]
MQQKKTFKMVGLFVLIGFLGLGSIISYYVRKQFETNDEDLVVMYFEESIRGLNVGSSVVFKGVEIGKVAKIKLLMNLKEGTFKTVVFVNVEGNEKIVSRLDTAEWEDYMLDNMIEKGLRAQLISANYLTGQLMIELVMVPESKIEMRGDGKYAEIPTILSPFAAISNDLKEVPLRESLIRFGNILKDVEDNLPQILENTTQITQRINTVLDKKSGETSKSMNSFNSAMEEISKTSHSIKNLMDYLERHPEALLRGKDK